MRFPKQFITSGALARARDLTGGDLRVLLALIVTAGDDAVATATQSDLSAMTGLGRRFVRDRLEHLHAGGYIKAQSGRGRTATYTIKLAAPPAIQMAPIEDNSARTELAAPPAISGVNLAAPPAISVETPTRVLNPSTGTRHDGFDEFYDIWPKKVNKPAAERAWDKAIKRTTPDTILAAATAYRDNPGRPDKQYIPYPATWLNADGWNDDLPERRNTNRPSGDAKAAALLDLGRRINSQERKAIA